MTQGNFTGVEIELHILINCGCSIPLNVQDQVGQGLKQSGLEEDVPADGRGGMGWVLVPFPIEVFHDSLSVINSFLTLCSWARKAEFYSETDVGSKVLIPELDSCRLLKKSIKKWNKSFPWHLADLHSFSHNFEALLLLYSASSNFRALSTCITSLWLYMKPFWWLSLIGLLHMLEVMILSSENYTLNLNLVASIVGVENTLLTRSSLFKLQQKMSEMSEMCPSHVQEE